MDVVTVTATGPLFDGRLDSGIQAGLNDGLDDVAQHGVNLVRAQMGRNFRHATGNAQRHVVITERAGRDRTIVDAVAYGAWLEGTSSRNQTTRFKGYHSFRQATQILDQQAGHIVDRAIGDRIVRL